MQIHGLFELLLSIKDINYFYFEQFLFDLVSKHFVAKYEKDSGIVYEITADGKKTLELTKNLLPGILKLKADTYLKETLEEIEDKTSIVAEYTPENEKNYLVNCKIVENHKNIFELKIACPPETAEIIVQNWQKNAISIYPKILALLNQKSHPAE